MQILTEEMEATMFRTRAKVWSFCQIESENHVHSLNAGCQCCLEWHSGMCWELGIPSQKVGVDSEKALVINKISSLFRISKLQGDSKIDSIFRVEGRFVFGS